MRSQYELLRACQQNDAKAQRILYDRFKGRLMGICRRYTRDREEAQDILQESFIKIFTKIGQLKEADRLEGWLKVIVIRTAINHFYRSRSREALFQQLPTYDTGMPSSPVVISEATDEYLVECVQSLPDGCRIIFNMFVVEGYSHSEIAEMLSISEGTSRSQLHRAKELLQQKLKSETLTDYYEKFA